MPLLFRLGTPAPCTWASLTLACPDPLWPSARGRAPDPNSVTCLGPTLLQLRPLGSWGRARPEPDDLTCWKGKFSAFLLQKTFAKCSAMRNSSLGFLEQPNASSTPTESSVEKVTSNYTQFCSNGQPLWSRGLVQGENVREAKGGYKTKASNTLSMHTLPILEKISSYSQK